MTSRSPLPLVALIVVTTFGEYATAQPPAPPRTPPTSPYLNLLRGGANPAVNYYGLVRPEQNLRQTLQGLQSATETNQQNINTLAAGELAPTGANAQFFNHGRYFMTQRSGGASGSPTAAGSFGTTTRPNQSGGMGMGGGTSAPRR